MKVQKEVVADSQSPYTYTPPPKEFVVQERKMLFFIESLPQLMKIPPPPNECVYSPVVLQEAKVQCAIERDEPVVKEIAPP